MKQLLGLIVFTFCIPFLLITNAFAWGASWGAAASAAASSGGGFSTGSFSCGGGGSSSSSSSSSSSYGGGYSSGTTASIGSGTVSFSTPSYTSSAGLASSTSSWMPSVSAGSYTTSSTSVPTITAESVFGVTSSASIPTTGATTYSGISGTGTTGSLQLSGTIGKEISSQVRSDLTSSSFMQQGAFAGSALINSDGITAQASRANFFANEATKPTISADEYHSNTAAAYIPASTTSTGVVVCSGASGENLAQGIVRPNTSTDGGVSLAHEADFTTSTFTGNAFFGTYITPQAARQAYSTTTSSSASTTSASNSAASYDLPGSVTKDSTYWAGGWYPVLSAYSATSSSWSNILDDGPTTNTYGLLANTVTDPLKATVTPEQ
ncbi:MAG: hypothetical protein WBE75_01770 [Candidatus Omnitrophota bacterium]|jgi:hypothetical protein